MGCRQCELSLATRTGRRRSVQEPRFIVGTQHSVAPMIDRQISEYLLNMIHTGPVWSEVVHLGLHVSVVLENKAVSLQDCGRLELNYQDKGLIRLAIDDSIWLRCQIGPRSPLDPFLRFLEKEATLL